MWRLIFFSTQSSSRPGQRTACRLEIGHSWNGLAISHIRAEAAAPVASVVVVVAASAWWPCGSPLLPRRYHAER
jgi:hypothetical protein